MTSFYEDQKAITDKIKALGVAQRFGTYDGALPTGDQLKATHGRYWPYAVYALGGKTPVAGRNRGIGSSKDDVKWTSLVFFCVGDTPDTVRRLKDVIRVEFEGYSPTPLWGEFTEVLTGDYGIPKPDPDLIPLRFGETLAFTVLTDN